MSIPPKATAAGMAAPASSFTTALNTPLSVLARSGFKCIPATLGTAIQGSALVSTPPSMPVGS